VAAVWLAPIQCQQFATCGLATLDGQGHIDQVVEGVRSTTDGDFTISPRITLGMQGDCWGVLARYWRFQNGSLDSDFAHPTCDGADGATCFNLETFDLEVTRLIVPNCDGRMLRASFGVRYAQMHEAANLSFSETGADGWYQSSVFARHDFSGPGLTMGLQGIRPVGCGCFNLFFDARLSFLFDDEARNYVETRADYVSDTPAHDAIDALGVGKADLFIGEIQVGGQWNLPLKCVPANAFVRCAFEYQYWCTSNAGYADSISGAGPSSGPVVFAAGSSAGDTHVNLVGFNITTGLTW
jgi:hypothetical protein